MPFLVKYFWIAFILVTFINAAIWWFRGKPHRDREPGLTEGYRSLIRGFVIWGNLPWLIMGAGILFGGVPSMIHYFDPRYPNPFVPTFFGSIFVVWIAGTYWLFARDGARRLLQHPGLLTRDISATALKLYWILSLAGGIAAFAFMYFGNVIPPELLESDWPSN